VRHLVGEHRGRRLGVLQRERAAEPAARVGRGQFDQVQAADVAQQLERLVPHAEHAQRVAGRVVGDAVREVRADVGHAEHVGEELGQLVGPARHRHGTPVQVRVHLADHPGTRTGRRDDRVVAVERLRVPLRELHRVRAVTRVVVHLAAAGLRRGEVDLAAEPLQQADHRTRGVGEERVGETCGEQRDPRAQRLFPSPASLAGRPQPLTTTWR
jgi:hypothetical protein